MLWATQWIHRKCIKATYESVFLPNFVAVASMLNLEDQISLVDSLVDGELLEESATDRIGGDSPVDMATKVYAHDEPLAGREALSLKDGHLVEIVWRLLVVRRGDIFLVQPVDGGFQLVCSLFKWEEQSGGGFFWQLSECYWR